MSLVSIKNITTGYGKKNILDNISYDINEGELVGILGANGCGKSTFVKAICNLLPHEGAVDIGENVIEDLKQKDISRLISYIPQHSGISIDISVLDVVMMGFNPKLNLFEYPSKEMKEQAINVLDRVGLSDMIHTNYMHLSEGQKQLVILSRALLNEGTLFVIDELESALDFGIRYHAMKLVRSWINEDSRAGIAIMHDIMLALNTCDKLLLIKDKKIAGIIDIKSDTIEEMEEKLSKIYEDICLTKVKGKSGKEKFVMIHDSEEI